MTPDQVSQTARAAWARLPEYARTADERLGWPLLTWLSGVCDTVDPDAALIRAGAALGDPATAPHDRLGWLAALGGVDTTGVPDADMRGYLADPAHRARGTPAQVADRVARTLTGGRHVAVVTPVDGDPWRVEVVTRTPQTPDPGAAAAAARHETPAWLALVLVQSAGTVWHEITDAGKTWDQAAALTWDQVQDWL